MKKKENNDDFSELSLKRFAILSTIGKGAFGSVKAIEDKKTKKKYALKFINKNHCIEDKATTLVFRERMMLQELSHTFIVALRYAFQDDEHLFMVLDLALGGDLRYNMYKCPMFDEHTLVVYTAEISSAVSYMHSKMIVHRDLKPENLLLDESGHIYLTDLNLATSLKKRKPTSQSGTLDYMAPEMHTSKPYGYSIDWWALGTILYECIYRKLPFGGGRNAAEVVENIMSVPLVFPETNVHKISVKNSKERIDFITACLQRDVKDRLGSKNDGLGFEIEIKTHPYLARIEWNNVLDKKLVPKYRPIVDKDNLNIPANVLIEDILGGENLHYKPRKKKIDLNDPNRKLTFTEKLANSMGNLFGNSKTSSQSLNGSNNNLQNQKLKSRKQIEKDQMDEYYIQFDWESQDQKPMILPEEPQRQPKSSGSLNSRQKSGIPEKSKLSQTSSKQEIASVDELSGRQNISKSGSSPNLCTKSTENLFIPKTVAKDQKTSPLREASLPQSILDIMTPQLQI